MSFLESLQSRAISLLRWSEKYTKTDMVYLAQAGFWSNLNVVIVSVLGLGLSIAFANFLPAEVYGTYQYLLSLSSLLTAICLTGMNIAVSQSVARGNEGDLKVAVRIQLWWNVVPVLVGIGVSVYYLAAGNALLAAGVGFVSLFAPLTNVFNTYTAFLQGKRDFKQLFVFTTATNLFYYAVMFPAVYLFHETLVIILVNLATNALATTYFYFRTMHLYQPNDRTDPHTVSYGTFLSVMNAFGTIVAQLDNVLVFHFLGPAELAVYSFASLVPERVASLFKFVTTAALPKFSTQAPEQIQRHIISKTLRASVPGIMAAAVYILLAPLFFHLLFPKYVEAISLSQLYAPYIITVAANIPAAAIAAMRFKRELYVFDVLTPAVLFGLQLFLLFQFGIAGILIARIISNTFNILLAILLILHPFDERRAS